MIERILQENRLFEGDTTESQVFLGFVTAGFFFLFTAVILVFLLCVCGSPTSMEEEALRALPEQRLPRTSTSNLLILRVTQRFSRRRSGGNPDIVLSPNNLRSQEQVQQSPVIEIRRPRTSISLSNARFDPGSYVVASDITL